MLALKSQPAYPVEYRGVSMSIIAPARHEVADFLREQRMQEENNSARDLHARAVAALGSIAANPAREIAERGHGIPEFQYFNRSTPWQNVSTGVRAIGTRGAGLEIGVRALQRGQRSRNGLNLISAGYMDSVWGETPVVLQRMLSCPTTEDTKVWDLYRLEMDGIQYFRKMSVHLHDRWERIDAYDGRDKKDERLGEISIILTALDQQQALF
jgi:hypothetical protein